MWTLSEQNISTNGSSDYFRPFSSNEIRACKIEQDCSSAVQDPEPLSILFFGTFPLSECFLVHNFMGLGSDHSLLMSANNYSHWITDEDIVK